MCGRRRALARTCRVCIVLALPRPEVARIGARAGLFREFYRCVSEKCRFGRHLETALPDPRCEQLIHSKILSCEKNTWAKPFLGRVRFFTFRPRTGRTASTTRLMPRPEPPWPCGERARYTHDTHAPGLDVCRSSRPYNSRATGEQSCAEHRAEERRRGSAHLSRATPFRDWRRAERSPRIAYQLP